MADEGRQHLHKPEFGCKAGIIGRNSSARSQRNPFNDTGALNQDLQYKENDVSKSNLSHVGEFFKAQSCAG